jgi:hypothetical protein
MVWVPGFPEYGALAAQFQKDHDVTKIDCCEHAVNVHRHLNILIIIITFGTNELWSMCCRSVRTLAARRKAHRKQTVVHHDRSLLDR